MPYKYDVEASKEFINSVEQATEIHLIGLSKLSQDSLRQMLNFLQIRFVSDYSADRANLILRRKRAVDNGKPKTSTVDAADLFSTLKFDDVAIAADAYKSRADKGPVLIKDLNEVGFLYPKKDLIKFEDGSAIRRGNFNLVGLKRAVAVDFVSGLIQSDKELTDFIQASQKARGFADGIKVGDTVEVRPLKDLIKEYGSIEREIIPNVQNGLLIPFARPEYGKIFADGLSYLCEKPATITSFDEETGVVGLSIQLDGKTITEVTEMRYGSVTYPAGYVELHETHLRKRGK